MLINTSQVAKIVGYSGNWVRQSVRNGEFPKPTRNGEWFYWEKSVIKAWAKRNPRVKKAPYKQTCNVCGEVKRKNMFKDGGVCNRCDFAQRAKTNRKYPYQADYASCEFIQPWIRRAW